MARIKLGISLKSLGLPFRRSLPQAQALGADAIELEASGELTPGNLTQTGRREITHLVRSHGLTISGIVCPLRRGLDVAENLEPRIDFIKQTMALASDLGPRLVIVQAGQIAAPTGGEPSRVSDRVEPAKAVGDPAMKESLETLGRHGDRTGVLIALDTGADAPATLVAFLNQIDVGSLAVNFNPANLVLSSHNPHDAVRTFQKRIVHVHAQDARRVSPNRTATVPLGHGDLDWLQLLANLEEIEYRGGITVLGNDRAESAAGLAFLRRLVV